jgi:23S rRNA pseudouridine955/2504/2580 synthase
VKVVSNEDPNGLRSISLVKVAQRLQLPNGEAASLLEVSIKTGRTHQIRVHLAHHGHPIVGDDKYGDFERNKNLAKLGMKRMYLHAWKLNFQHPTSQQAVQLEAVCAFSGM